MTTPAHILIADDDPTLSEAVCWYLEAEGFRVTRVADGPAALAAFRTERPDAVVLDIMMPDADGFAVCRAMRADDDVPILMLSARDGEADKVRALGLGADDYVVKPFGAMELVARVKALLRRAGRAATPALRGPGLEVYPDEHRALVHGAEVALSALEFDLLLTLLRRPRVVCSRQQLADLVWGDDFSGDPRLVDSHIYHLRDKLTAAGLRPCPIATVRGVGYAFRPDH
jgi:two-component system response regulator MtrA